MTAAALGAVVGAATNLSGPLVLVAFVVPLLCLVTAAQLRNRTVVPLGAIAFAVAPMPVFVPTLLPFGSRSLFVLDVVLPLVAAWALTRPGASRGADRAVLFYTSVVFAAALVGISAGAAPSVILQDARGPLYLICGYLISSRLLRWQDGGRAMRVGSVVLWWSAAAITVSLVTGQELLQGRVGTIAGFTGGGTQGLDAVRFLIASKELALVASLGVIGALLLRTPMRRPHRAITGLLLPGAFVVFMAFSRQSLVGAAIALLYLFAISPLRSQTVIRAGAGVLLLTALLAMLTMSGLSPLLTSDDTVIGRQVTGYTERVVDGLLGETVTEDPGNQFRIQENEAVLDFVRRHPATGAGLGMPYRGDLELEAFENDPEYGRRYVHNVYLWYAAHAGLLGLVAVGVLLGRPLLRVIVPAFRTTSEVGTIALVAGAPYVALLVIGLVEPVIHLNTTAPLAGAFLGFFAMAETRLGGSAGQSSGAAERPSTERARAAVRSLPALG